MSILLLTAKTSLNPAGNTISFTAWVIDVMKHV